jgi:hypothetical protein
MTCEINAGSWLRNLTIYRKNCSVLNDRGALATFNLLNGCAALYFNCVMKAHAGRTWNVLRDSLLCAVTKFCMFHASAASSLPA